MLYSGLGMIFRPVRVLLAIFLATLVCAAGIAVFSPLHKHHRGQCSLHNLEGCQPDQVMVAVPVPLPGLSGWLDQEPAVVVRLLVATVELPARAPPAGISLLDRSGPAALPHSG